MSEATRSLAVQVVAGFIAARKNVGDQSDAIIEEAKKIDAYLDPPKPEPTKPVPEKTSPSRLPHGGRRSESTSR